MWYVEVLSVSIHEGTTQVTEPFDRVMAPRHRGLHAIGPCWITERWGGGGGESVIEKYNPF
jgi:hypothetical protein